MISEEYIKSFVTEPLDIFSSTKDNNFIFTGCSENFVKLAGEDSAHSMIGKNDYELVWRADADPLHEKEIQVMRGEINYINIVERVNLIRNGQEARQSILTTKTPIYNSKEDICGIAISFVFLGKPFPKDMFLDESGCLNLPHQFGNECLRKKEVSVLKRILLGETAGAIAKYLNIPCRTVEHYTNNLKRKLQCRYKHQINRAAIEMGLVHLLGVFN